MGNNGKLFCCIHEVAQLGYNSRSLSLSGDRLQLNCLIPRSRGFRYYLSDVKGRYSCVSFQAREAAGVLTSCFRVKGPGSSETPHGSAFVVRVISLLFLHCVGGVLSGIRNIE